MTRVSYHCGRLLKSADDTCAFKPAQLFIGVSFDLIESIPGCFFESVESISRLISMRLRLPPIVDTVSLYNYKHQLRVPPSLETL